MAYDTIASDEQIETTKAALEANGFRVMVADSEEQAKQEVLMLLPKGAQVMTSTSATLESLGLNKAINDTGEYDSVRQKLSTMAGDDSLAGDRRRLGAAPDYIVGSIHALTEDGHALIASATGSQLPAYTFGAGQVIWVVGAQKIVKNLDEAEKRLEQHVFPLENERSKKAYGSGSGINKLLVFNKEVQPGRVTIVIVKRALGF